MKDDRIKKKKTEKKPASALNVMKGVEGGHDGLKPKSPRPDKSVPRGNNKVLDISTDEYIKGVLKGDRVLLSRAITLIESNARRHQEQAQEVLKAIMPHTGKSIRIGVTGVPGAGKSTLIENFGCYLLERGHKVAVMAVDPSSVRTRGSILGDKTRMEKLAQAEAAFIRPSPSGGTLGGVARKTRETMMLFEAAGYDVLLVETVGVGQSEITVRSMVDFFMLMLITGAGDELQRIKKGVFEMADMIIVNKADNTNARAAEIARGEYERALHYLQPVTVGWDTCALTTSALNGVGIDEVWWKIEKFREITAANGEFAKRRREQARDWLYSLVDEKLHEAFNQAQTVKEILPGLEQEVMQGKTPAVQAAQMLVKAFKTHINREWKLDD
ncbi:MAG: methylmalonyl Co-A mutase-associated GTPase MeaB [Candidatus Zixiibacteriota bacterium]